MACNEWGTRMVVGVLISAIAGGVAAVGMSLGADRGVAHAIASYPLGGLLAVMSFLAMSVMWQGLWAAQRR